MERVAVSTCWASSRAAKMTASAGHSPEGRSKGKSVNLRIACRLRAALRKSPTHIRLPMTPRAESAELIQKGSMSAVFRAT